MWSGASHRLWCNIIYIMWCVESKRWKKKRTPLQRRPLVWCVKAFILVLLNITTKKCVACKFPQEGSRCGWSYDAANYQQCSCRLGSLERLLIEGFWPCIPPGTKTYEDTCQSNDLSPVFGWVRPTIQQPSIIVARFLSQGLMDIKYLHNRYVRGKAQVQTFMNSKHKFMAVGASLADSHGQALQYQSESNAGANPPLSGS